MKLPVIVSRNELEELREKARLEGVSLSAYVRAHGVR